MTTSDVGTPARIAQRLIVVGLVQGVGFRPFVQRLATRLGLGGWVRNESGGVGIHVEGKVEDVERFVRGLRSGAPPLSRIESVSVAEVMPTHDDEFRIVTSLTDATQRLPVSPDVAMCSACERELLNATDRRYHYPFITCTDCGPRFTVIESMPYDRERTSMRAFPQCPTCTIEYSDPASRRFHCESNSCPDCGPALWLETAGQDTVTGYDAAIAEAARLLRDGSIVAIRGLGGFHLAVDARNEGAVERLRSRKGRDAKPLAVMVATASDVESLCHVDPAEGILLTGTERPVVLLRRRIGATLAPSIAPGLDTVGVMVAYTPLHRLLLEAAGCPLIMTSGNVSDEPIAIANDDARIQLRGIADAWLLHNRDIVSRYDDSVVRHTEVAPIVVRRARGYAPLPLTLPIPAPRPLLAVGPHLKNTFTLADGDTAYVSQHIGDLEALETLDHFGSTLDAYRRLFRIEPEVVVRDLHPDYLSSHVANDLHRPTIIVQHHHAHLGAVVAEHGVSESVIGVIFDGTGYGEDRCVWGGEILVGDLISYSRVAHVRYVPLPGGDRAARQLWRIVEGWSHVEPSAAQALGSVLDRVPELERRTVRQQLDRGLNSPLSSSMGRLFDAASVLIGVRQVARYEGQAAMELESLAGDNEGMVLPYSIWKKDDGCFELDPVPTLLALIEGRDAGLLAAELSASFHETIAAATVELVCHVSEDRGLDTVALGGGVFQNARLLRTIVPQLEAASLNVLLAEKLGPNDGAISYGQAAIAAAVLARDGNSDFESYEVRSCA